MKFSILKFLSHLVAGLFIACLLAGPVCLICGGSVYYMQEFGRAYDWILFVDCREPEEIQKLKERLNATTVLVRRLGDETNETSNHADANVFEYEYDYTIKNYGDLSDLVVECVGFLDYMKEREPYVD